MILETYVGPRERLDRVGPEGLSDAELLAILLGTGTAGISVEVLATQLLGASSGLRGLARMGPGELAAAPGVGHGKACRVVAAFELGRRAIARPIPRGVMVTSSRSVVDAFRPRLAGLDAEHFLAIPLDAKNRALGELRLGLGGLLACPVTPADVFRALLRHAASGVVFVHNHPSGDPTPSAEDVSLTERLVRAGELIGIRVLDHVIIGAEGYYSFFDAGTLAACKHEPAD